MMLFLNPSGLGWVLRDEKGQVKWMGTQALPRTRTVEETEFEALRWAIVTTRSLGYNRVLFESDSKEVVSNINAEAPRPVVRTLANDIKGLLKTMEGEVLFHLRQGNRVADSLAKTVFSGGSNVPKLYTNVPN